MILDDFSYKSESFNDTIVRNKIKEVSRRMQDMKELDEGLCFAVDQDRFLWYWLFATRIRSLCSVNSEKASREKAM